MYKSSLLSHVIRASRQHPFFTQNLAGSNPTALTCVQPKLGLATEKAYFSSWGGNGHTASNSTGSSSSQSALVAISSDDNQNWERDLGLHRKQYRSIAGIRRYSTGTSVVSEQTQDKPTLHLLGSDSETVVKNEPFEGEHEHTNSLGDDVSSIQDVESTSTTSIPLVLEVDLSKQFQAREYTPLLETFVQAVDSGTIPSVSSFNIVFETLNELDIHPEIEYHAQRVLPFVGPAAFLHFYSIMLERDLLPNARTYELILQYLVRHSLDVINIETYLKGTTFVVGTPQEEFNKPNDESLRASQEVDASSLALSIFKASNAVQPTTYPKALLEKLLSICVLKGKIDDAISVFDHYDVTGLPRTAQTYRTLLHVFARARDLPGAIECFDTWKRECHQLPEHDYFSIYDALVRCYFAVGDHEGGLKFFESAVRANRGAHSRYYENIIRYFGEEGCFDEAISYARERRGKTPIAFSRALGLVIVEACAQNQPEVALSAFKDVQSLKAFDEIPNATWRYLGVLITEGQLDEAKVFVDDCVREQVELRLVHLSSLITKYLEAGRTRDAFDIVQYVGDRRAVSDRVEFNKHKTSLFIQLFLQDLSRLHLSNAENTPRVIHFIYMLGQNAKIPIVAEYLSHIRDYMTSEDWLASAGLLNELCIVSFRIFRVASDTETTKDTLRFTNEKEYLTWLVETITYVSSKGQKSAVHLQGIDLLLQALEVRGLTDLRDQLTDCQTQSAVSETPSDHPSQLPLMHQVFLGPADTRINQTLSAELSKAVELADSRIFGRNKQPERISASRMISLLEKSSHEGYFVDGVVLLKILEHFGRLGRAREVDKVLGLSEKLLPMITLSDSLLRSARAILYNSATITFNELRDSEIAQRYHDKILDEGFVPSATAYASFIAKMDERVHRDMATRAVMLFKEALRLGVRPTEYLFNTVIAKLAKARRNDEALAMFKEMKVTGLAPNAVTYGTVINSCCRVGETETAEQLLTELEQLPRHQSRIAPYNTLLQHFVQVKKDRAKAFFYWDKLRARAISPTPHTYRLLIEAHGHLEPVDPVGAESVVEMMQANRVCVETIHHAAIIHMYGVVLQDLPAARRYFDWCIGGPQARVVADDVIFQSMIEACVLAKDFTGMQHLLQQMNERKIELNAYIVNLAIQGYGHSEQLDRARELFDQLPTSGAGKWGKEPSTYESMIRAYNSAAQPTKSVEILDLLRSQRYPDAVVHRAAALIESAA
ncbi:PPR repeat protein [Taphrina deformans PYCC 5710]|uniref:PPR repeat protein n=1 Tax=Taphrina deformans (strain PYCC 5710 / ATCC 11124 / CBS 356.35 / IMI 108563 / JCM 9778 / NBRC 8474) TaxID=1097556 RepID=R4XIE4_TAPDE|nr:PPR repeat protein [Taphrina deformans PYCC 5710]|eukprot:CCG83127.1 PPR repeat protein [Taphrina deformans PYCC 5710]